ncbi:hypothetical protein Hanom_Chr05g00465141 [Helianthus anomalus]
MRLRVGNVLKGWKRYVQQVKWVTGRNKVVNTLEGQHANSQYNITKTSLLNELRAVCLPLNRTLNVSDFLLVQHLMVQTVCFASKCLNL